MIRSDVTAKTVLKMVLIAENQLLPMVDWKMRCAQSKVTTVGICDRGCQMVCFQTKNPNLGKSRRGLEWKMLLYFMIIWNILWPFDIMYTWQLGKVCSQLVYWEV
jgi:hypothetical protein